MNLFLDITKDISLHVNPELECYLYHRLTKNSVSNKGVCVLYKLKIALNAEHVQ